MSDTDDKTLHGKPADQIILDERQRSSLTDRQTLYNEVNRFDDAYWVRHSADQNKHRREQAEQLSLEEARDLLCEYWQLMSTLLCGETPPTQLPDGIPSFQSWKAPDDG